MMQAVHTGNWALNYRKVFMPRYSAQNLAAIDPEYRKAHNIGSGGTGGKKSRYAYGKQNNVLVAAGRELLDNGMCLRLLPIYEEGGSGGSREFVNLREGRDGVAFGDWSRLMTCAHWVGNPGVCFIIHDGNPEVNLYESPLHVLRKAAWDNKDTPGIGRLFSDLLSKNFVRDSHIGSLKKPEKTLFISASVVYVDENGQVVLGAFSDDEKEKRRARVIGLKTSATQALYSALSVRDESTGEYMSGDMLSFGSAKLITFLPDNFVSGSKNVIATSAAGPATFQCPKFALSNKKDAQFVVGYPQSRSDFTHFAVLHDTYQGQEVSLEPYADKIVAETQSWDDYLWVPTYEEQAELLATAFPREALDFAWREFPEYLRTVPKSTATFTGAGVDVEELEEEHMERTQPAAKPKAAAKAPPADPPAPWDPQPEVAGEISPEAADSVADMFSASAPAPAAPAPAAQKRDSADILARARARASAK